MEIINLGLTKKITKDWLPINLAIIKRLELEAGELVIIFLYQEREKNSGWPQFSKPFYEISISFSIVSKFEFRMRNSTLYQISGFNIIDISQNGWEDVNFEIQDYEDGAISFYCKTITINSVSGPIYLPEEYI